MPVSVIAALEDVDDMGFPYVSKVAQNPNSNHRRIYSSVKPMKYFPDNHTSLVNSCTGISKVWRKNTTCEHQIVITQTVRVTL